MSFESEFLKPMQGEIEKKVKEPAVGAVKVTTEEILDSINESWPAYTYWSKNNHRITIGGGKDFPLQPAVRPEKEGSLMDAAETTMSAEKKKLDGLKFDNLEATIGNAVPYAMDVNLNPKTGVEVRSKGSGTMIYNEAAAEGAAKAAAKIKQGTTK